MSDFKNYREIYDWLLEGGKIKHKEWDENYLKLEDGVVVNKDSDPAGYHFRNLSAWQKVKEKKVYKFYRHFYICSGGPCCTGWTDSPWTKYNAEIYTLLKTEAKEIEA